MSRRGGWSCAAALLVVAAAAWAGDAPPVEPAQLAGNTLSAVAYVPTPAGGSGGALQRIMLQAYLAADGSTVVRRWLPERNSYSAPAQTRWSLSQNRLCIDMPAGARGTAAAPARESLCAIVHVWWPRIAGIGTQPYAMLDGDLQPGNAIFHTARRGSAPR
jgi:hypothetical protein